MKYKKSLLTIGIASSAMLTLASVISCGNSNGLGNGITADDIKQADNILKHTMQSSNYKLGPANNEQYNPTIKRNTKEIGFYLEHDLLKESAVIKTSGIKTLKEEWETYFPIGKTKQEQKTQWNIFIDKLLPGAKTDSIDYATFKHKMVPSIGANGKPDKKHLQEIATNDKAEELLSNLSYNLPKDKQNLKDMFEKDFWGERNSKGEIKSYDLRRKNFNKNKHTVFPSHYDSPVVQLMWAKFLRIIEQTQPTQSEKEQLVRSFIFRWNIYLNRRQFTYPATTGAGFSMLVLSKKDSKLLPFSLGQYPGGIINNVLRSYMSEPNLSKKDININDVQKNGHWITYKNPKLRKYIINLMDDFTSTIFFKGQHEYDNWWHYEKKMPEVLATWCMILSPDKEFRKKINSKWAKPADWFAGDPLYQHASEGAIYNSVNASKLMNSGANLFDYIATSIKMDLIKGDIKLAKKHMSYVYTYLLKNYSKTFVDGYKPDGGFIQHNSIPHQNNYGEITLLNVLRLQKEYQNTQLDLFANYPGVQNIYKLIVKSFLPLFFNGHLSPLTEGRKIVEQLKPINGKGNNGLTPDQLKKAAEAVSSSKTQGEKVIKHIAGLMTFANRNNPYVKILLQFLTEQRRNNNPLDGLNEARLKSWGFDARLIQETNELLKKPEQTNLLSKITQIWSEDIQIINHDEKGLDNDWRFSTRFHDTRVGQYEGQLGENLQGIYMGDGLQILKTGKNPHMYNSMYWAAIDPYHLPGTVAYTPNKIPNPDKYYIPGLSVKPSSELGEANYTNNSWSLKDRQTNGTLAAPHAAKNDITDQTEIKLPNEWVESGASSWSIKVNSQKNDATAQGFSGGVQMYGISSSMNYSSSWDNMVTQRRSVFSLGDRIFVMGQVQNPHKNVALTIDNRRTTDGTGKYTPDTFGPNNKGQIFNYSGSGENIGYIIENNRKATVSQRVVGQNTGNTDVNRSWKAVQASFKKLYSKTNFDLHPNGYYNRLMMNMDTPDGMAQPNATFAYSIVPNKNPQQVKTIANSGSVKIIRNDQFAQIIEYKNAKGEEYLLANIFENNNFDVTVPWFGDKLQPVRLTATHPASMIFKKDSKEVNRFEVMAQSALHNNLITRVGFGKDIKKLEIPFDNFKLFRPENNPQYWTKKEEQYQNGKLIRDLSIADEQWFKQHTKARVMRARDMLNNVGEYYNRKDQIDLIPDPRFEIQDVHHFFITINNTEK